MRICLENITRILQDESHGSAPHLCIEYAANARIYTPATDLAISSSNEGVIHGTLDLLNLLVDTEERNFLDDPAFAATITAFAKRVLISGLSSVKTEASLFEVLFGIAAKLRLQPEYLRHWFKPGAQDGDEAIEFEAEAPAKSYTFEGDFPLFYLLLDRIYHDGRVGEFARTGLLYVIESAARSESLEKWIVECDLATLMASGLGALYSQLSRSALFCLSGSVVSLICLES